MIYRIGTIDGGQNYVEHYGYNLPNSDLYEVLNLRLGHWKNKQKLPFEVQEITIRGTRGQ